MEKTVTAKALEGFEAFLIENEKTKATVEKYMRDIRCFLRCTAERELDKSLAEARDGCNDISRRLNLHEPHHNKCRKQIGFVHVVAPFRNRFGVTPLYFLKVFTK